LQKTESGKDEIEALKDQVSAKQLKEVHEEDSKKSEREQVEGDALAIELICSNIHVTIMKLL
jgi:hypothetical protein